MAKINRPEANPVVALLLTIFIFELGHLIINGQSKKWVTIILSQIVISIVGVILCGIPGLLFYVFSIIDSYKTAERLHAGETLDENEYSFELLYKIVKIYDKSAIFTKPAV